MAAGCYRTQTVRRTPPEEPEDPKDNKGPQGQQD